MDLSSILQVVITVVVSGFIGYIFGSAKTFREQKLKAYEEILPPIIRAAFERSRADQPEFNSAILKLWLFGSKRVVLNMDHALSTLVSSDRGDSTKALQKLIVETRADIQSAHVLFWRRVRSDDVSHFYTRFVG